MQIRLDNMSNVWKGQATQLIHANSAYVEHAAVTATAIGASFTYLGKIFNFSMKHEKAKDALTTKLRFFLDVTNSLQIPVQKQV